MMMMMMMIIIIIIIIIILTPSPLSPAHRLDWRDTRGKSFFAKNPDWN